jgi:hypothetical protein
MGTFGEEALALVHDLGKRLRESSGDGRETTWLIQRISVAIQRGNAASICLRFPRTFLTTFTQSKLIFYSILQFMFLSGGDI